MTLKEELDAEISKYKGQRLENNRYIDVAGLREDPDKIDWFYHTVWYIMNETQIREFKDYLDWEIVKIYQNISKDFKREIEDEHN